jgi:hypothetical protein
MDEPKFRTTSTNPGIVPVTRAWKKKNIPQRTLRLVCGEHPNTGYPIMETFNFLAKCLPDIEWAPWTD